MSTQTVSLRLLLTGNAGAELRRIAQQNIRDTRSINDMQRLGLQTQRQIDREIRNQQRSYRRLRDSGVASANDIRRAHRAMTEEIRRLNGELRTGSSLMGKMQTAGAVVGGAVAAGAVVNSQIKPARSYDKQLAFTAGTATYGKGMTVAERKAVKVELSDTVMAAVRQNGGTREGGLEAADTLIASGSYDLASVKQVLGATQRASFVTDATPADAAAVTLQLKNFGIAPEDIKRGQDIAVAGGQLGGFEYDTMSTWLSRQLPFAANAGYGGLEGLKQVVTMNQLAMSTAGTQDEAGNNVKNLLQKINTPVFSKAIAKNVQAQAGDPVDSDGNLIWSQYALQQKEQGVDQVAAFVGLLEREMAGNRQYQDLKKQAANAEGKEAQALYEQMSRLLEGNNVGETVTDVQALQAAIAIANGGSENERITAGLDNADGTIDGLYELFKDDEWATAMARQQEMLNINSNLYETVNDGLSGFNQAMSGFMEKHEGLATAAYAAGLTLAAIAAGGTVGSLVGGGTGGAKGVLKGAGTGALLAGAGAAGYAGGTWLSENFIEGTSFGDAIGEKIAQTLALFGNDEAQAALDANAKTDQMIAEQQEAKQIQLDMSSKLSSQQQQMINQQGQMIGQLQAIASKPVPTFNPNITIGGRPVAMDMMSEIDKQSKRGKYGPYS